MSRPDWLRAGPCHPEPTERGRGGLEGGASPADGESGSAGMAFARSRSLSSCTGRPTPSISASGVACDAAAKRLNHRGRALGVDSVPRSRRHRHRCGARRACLSRLRAARLYCPPMVFKSDDDDDLSDVGNNASSEQRLPNRATNTSHVCFVKECPSWRGWLRCIEQEFDRSNYRHVRLSSAAFRESMSHLVRTVVSKLN